MPPYRQRSALKSSLPAHNFQRIRFNYLITSIILVHVADQSPKVKHAKNQNENEKRKTKKMEITL